jgi:hypothetical protein
MVAADWALDPSIPEASLGGPCTRPVPRRSILPASIRFRAMGVLDDAIREHLELKRQHGAPEEELRRQEEEALGPVRREIEAAEEAETSGDGEAPAEPPETASEGNGEPAGPGLAPFDGEEPSQQVEPRADDPEPEPFDEETAPVVPEPAEPVEPLPDPEEPEATAEPEPDWFDSQPEPSEDHPREASRRFERESDAADGGPSADTPTAEDDEAGAEGDSAEERQDAGDVLEDTPDFLEETPEHDRLWFEQKPPRDFDFD